MELRKAAEKLMNKSFLCATEKRQFVPKKLKLVLPSPQLGILLHTKFLEDQNRRETMAVCVNSGPMSGILS